ncbi:MAG: hypothetical protein ACE5GB_02125 [Acidimicrobiales bacterium]
MSDTIVAWSWVPFALVAWAVLGDSGRMSTLLTVTLIWSFSHQPLTMLFIYGDRANPGRARALHLIAPAAFLGLIVLGMWTSPVAVAVIAAVWNAEHTIMQRFGLTRRYGQADDLLRFERAMMLWWLVLAATWAAADPRTGVWLDELRLGRRNRDGIEVLLDLQPAARVVLVPMVLWVAGLTVRWLRAERALPAERVNPAKRSYVAATASLIAVMVIHPFVGLVAYVGSHAVEYQAFVTHTLDRKYGRRPEVVAVIAGPVRRLGSAPVVAGFTIVLLGTLYLARSTGLRLAATYAALTLGAMHLFFDAYIWRRRRVTAIA